MRVKSPRGSYYIFDDMYLPSYGIVPFSRTIVEEILCGKAADCDTMPKW
jgi:hypothetical protein